MKKIILACGLISMSIFCFANNDTTSKTKPTVPYQASFKTEVRPAVLGLWAINSFKNQCVEYYNFRTEKQLFVKSGKEWVYGLYQYEYPENTQESLPLMYLRIEYDNNEADCAGIKQDQTGDMSINSVKWINNNQFELCHEDGKNCWATLERVSP